ncbi:MAG: UPF0280 family protein [bacterium]
MQPTDYKERSYRSSQKSEGLISFHIVEDETDLYISAERDLTNLARDLMLKYRTELRGYIKRDPIFFETLSPFKVKKDAPVIIKDMAYYTAIAGVGPMAAVAGAMAEYIGKELLSYSKEVIIENGGDIFMYSLKERKIGIFTGEDSPFHNKLAIKIKGDNTTKGICTSSGTIGHSLSFGKADAACIIATSTLLADAVATAFGNIVKKPEDIQKGLEFCQTIRGVEGALVVIQDKLGAWGEVELTEW